MKEFKSYLEYQDISSDWVDQVPYHWEFCPVRRIFRSVNGATPASENEDYWGGDIPWATPEDLGLLEGGTLLTTKRYITWEGYKACGTELVPKGSLLLSIRAPVGYVSIAGKPICTNQGCRSLVPKKQVDTGYFYYQLSILSDLLNNLSGGSTFRELSSATLASIPFALPPLEEQQKIAQFLDYQTAKIDRLIEKQQRLVDLLEEKQKAEIARAVTSGLNPDVSFKDSDISWLGRIPEHWQIVYLKRAIKYSDYGISESIVQEGYVGVLRMNNIHGGEIFWDGLGFIDDAPRNLLLSPGDILFNRTNSLDQVGKVAIFRNDKEFPVTFASYLVRLRPNNNTLSTYLNYLSRYLKEFGVSSAHSLPSISQTNLNPDRFGRIRICLPPIKEQKEIVAWLDHKLEIIKHTKYKAFHTIERLKEYRTALISAVVTGKIDVRDWQPPETEAEGSDMEEALNG